MSMKKDKTLCRTPTPNKKPTNIPTWKYDVFSETVVKALKQAGDEGLTLKELIHQVGQSLSETQKKELGSVGWHVTTVKLEMEVRQELKRFQKNGRQHIVVA